MFTFSYLFSEISITDCTLIKYTMVSLPACSFKLVVNVQGWSSITGGAMKMAQNASEKVNIFTVFCLALPVS